MAESEHPLGYQCEFIDTVHDNFYCKKCTLVARRLTLTICCGESYCNACIADIQQQDKSCPECGHQNITTVKPLKYQHQMDCLKVCCSMKGRGCDWLGTLGQLDAHLDPDQNNCQHLDIKCPLNCQQKIPRNKVVQHVAMECVKRDYVCRYCDFKATYEVMEDTHWPVCIYFPLQCPNFCGVTFERDDREHHMRMCRLEEVACEFSAVGCDVRFRREDQEEHARQYNQKHLTMTAVASVKINQKLEEQEEKLQEQEEKLQEQEEKLQEQEEKLQEQEEKLQEQEKKLQEQEEKLQDQKSKLQEEKQKTEKELLQQEQKFEKRFEVQGHKFHQLLQELDKKLQVKLDQNEVLVKKVTDFSLKRTFVMENYSKEKEKDQPNDWKSPAMYTHLCGYKFCIGINANGFGDARGRDMVVDLWIMQGDYDLQLKWPAHASFTIELLHQHGGPSIIQTSPKIKWMRPKTTCECKFNFVRFQYVTHGSFLEHSKLTSFLANDTLYFHLSNITVY